MLRCNGEAVTFSNIPALPDPLFSLLRDMIRAQIGISYEEHNRDMLASKVFGRMLDLGFDSFLDYYYLLKYDSNAAAEWEQLADILTVRETFFWREIEPLKALIDVILPQHQATSPNMPFKIWSAACASGEEPLTIAIALHEAGWFERIPISIHGSDISTYAITQAQRGIYTERSFRTLPPALRSRYFHNVAGGYQIDPAIHARVQWSNVNLLESSTIAPLAAVSAIFCRNVFIYFSEDTIRRIVRLFYQHMPVPGYLFVGVSEPLLRLTTEFTMQEISGTFTYVKH